MSRLVFSPRRVAVALLVAVAAIVASPTLATAIGIDTWNLPALQEELAAGVEKSREYTRDADDVMRRMELKGRLVEDLIEGRTTLAVVTAQFLDMNRNRTGYMTVIRAQCPGRTDEECTARNVLDYVAKHLPSLPASSRGEVAARLDAVFAALVGHSASAE